MGGAESKTVPGMIDLEAKLKQWAWNIYASRSDALTYNEIEMSVLWDSVHFDTYNVDFTEKTGPALSQTMLVFRSEYENNTQETQEHNFTTTRTTESTTTTVLTNGFTRGVRTGINIPIPQEVSDVTSGFGNEVAVESDERNTVKHAVTWSANSKIRVPPMTRTVAELKIQQERFKCRFDAVVAFRGRVKVRFNHFRSRQLLTVLENDISTIVADVFERNNLVMNNPEVVGSVSREGRKIYWPVKGVVDFNYGVSQKVEVSHVKTANKSKSAGGYHYQ